MKRYAALLVFIFLAGVLAAISSQALFAKTTEGETCQTERALCRVEISSDLSAAIAKVPEPVVEQPAWLKPAANTKFRGT